MPLLLKSTRLTIKLVAPADLESIHALHSLPETDAYNTLGIPESLEHTKQILQEWINASQKDRQPEYTFSITHEKKFIGLIALKVGREKYKRAEVWYKLDVAHWGKGFATEALDAVLAFGFEELKLHRIEAGCAVANTGSVRVMEKVGMSREGRKRKVLPLKSGWSDNFEYGILAEEWEPRPMSRSGKATGRNPTGMSPLHQV
ncbi:GNAT family N-acetyltransferase [Pontibacter akesuensis]|uniref:Protein N-acetyltransferase, RimJ/RimL family n=1 Tax=Pontibacter akesuensis TaxID=388950 RepID=A0A1I7FXA2_9BACT|nr:GNAT family protein [Pontibacter akesuensis]GHA60094.1 ribosomal-protein-serine acetyltransferase [Pontibacter akesuensis]SFU40706.1 Protein N-acetyltransferase, RimJ/RimL family [Pontibacter akesuensis]